MLLHFGYHLTIHPKCWEILCQHEVCPMHAHQSWQAASISRFRTTAALSSSRRCAWWQTVRDTFFQPFRNAISRQSLGKLLVTVVVWWLPSWCITSKLLFHRFIAFLSQTSLLQVGAVWTYSRMGISTHYHVTLQSVNVMHPATQKSTWMYFPRQHWVHMAELVHKAVCWISSKFESMKVIRSFDHMV